MANTLSMEVNVDSTPTSFGRNCDKNSVDSPTTKAGNVLYWPAINKQYSKNRHADRRATPQPRMESLFLLQHCSLKPWSLSRLQSLPHIVSLKTVILSIHCMGTSLLDLAGLVSLLLSSFALVSVLPVAAAGPVPMRVTAEAPGAPGFLEEASAVEGALAGATSVKWIGTPVVPPFTCVCV